MFSRYNHFAIINCILVVGRWFTSENFWRNPFTRYIYKFMEKKKHKIYLKYSIIFNTILHSMYFQKSNSNLKNE